jgi:gas vesicle protein
VDAASLFEIAFAASVVLAAATLAVAMLGRVPRRVLFLAATAIGGLAVAAWTAFALDASADLAVAAAGLTASLLVIVGSVFVQRGVARGRRVESEIAAAEARLRTLIERASEERAAELERTLARARADSASMFAEQERHLAEERRAAIAQREDAIGRELAEALAATQRRVEQRLGEWSEDLERAQGHLTDQVQRLAARQRRVIEEAEERLGADAERLESESEAQRAGLMRLREELERATQEAIASATAELDAHAVDRRRALHELSERLRRRERELHERVEREETEAVQRIHATFADMERRLVDRLERVVERTTQQYAEAATLQFAEAIKGSREEAARRLSRELDRAVSAFAHQAESVLGEQLATVGETAAQRLERRLSEAGSAVDRQSEELVSGLEQRLAAAETEMRRRLAELAADSEAERGVLEARLHELHRRIEQTLAHAETLDSA